MGEPLMLTGIHEQVLAPAPVNEEVCPLQTEAGEAVAVTVGKELTVDVSVVVLAHCPKVGVKVQVALVVLLIVEGLQVPVIPLVDVVGKRGAVEPTQKAGIGLKVGVSMFDTVMVTVADAVHPREEPPTVQVVVAKGETMTDAPGRLPGTHIQEAAPIAVSVVFCPSQIVVGAPLAVTEICGFTVTVTVVEPVQLAAVPVTVQVVVVVGETEAGFVVKLLGIHKYVVPTIVLVTSNETAAPEQIVAGVALETKTGFGLTVMVQLDGVPMQPLMVGVTVMVAVMGALVALVAVNEGIFPVPFAPKPIAGFEFVHVKVPPVGVLTKFVAATLSLLHTTTLVGTKTVGGGFTVTEAVVVTAAQVPEAGMV